MQENLSLLSLVQLRELAKERGVKRITSLRKSELIEVLQNMDGAAGTISSQLSKDAASQTADIAKDTTTKRTKNADTKKTGDAGTRQMQNADPQQIKESGAKQIKNRDFQQPDDTETRQVKDTDSRKTNDIEIKQAKDTDSRQINDTEAKQAKGIDFQQIKNTDTKTADNQNRETKADSDQPEDAETASYKAVKQAGSQSSEGDFQETDNRKITRNRGKNIRVNFGDDNKNEGRQRVNNRTIRMNRSNYTGDGANSGDNRNSFEYRNASDRTNNGSRSANNRNNGGRYNTMRMQTEGRNQEDSRTAGRNQNWYSNRSQEDGRGQNQNWSSNRGQEDSRGQNQNWNSNRSQEDNRGQNQNWNNNRGQEDNRGQNQNWNNNRGQEDNRGQNQNWSSNRGQEDNRGQNQNWSNNNNRNQEDGRGQNWNNNRSQNDSRSQNWNSSRNQEDNRGQSWNNNRSQEDNRNQNWSNNRNQDDSRSQNWSNNRNQDDTRNQSWNNNRGQEDSRNQNWNSSRGQEEEQEQNQSWNNSDADAAQNTASSNSISETLESLDSGNTAHGILEIITEGYGFIRSENYMTGDRDVYVSPSQIRRFNLKTGDMIEGSIRISQYNEKYPALLYITSVNGEKPENTSKRPSFESLVPVFPNSRLSLETPGCTNAMRIMNLFSPIGKGQRGMIVSPPKAGKTTLLKQVANAVITNHPEVHLIILLIDERPEEVTDIKESIEENNENVEVIYSTFDELPEHHRRVSGMVLERAKRLVEHGGDVMILLDSITRLTRACNLTVTASGRTLSGGLDPAALHFPKKFFGAARNMKNGGSLTILATALVDTGSRMDDVVFEEFKGTGNMEVVLDRKLSERRIFPAIDILRSGTRRDDLLLGEEEQEAMEIIRNSLATMKAEEITERVLKVLQTTKNNTAMVELIRKMKSVPNFNNAGSIVM